MEYFDFTAIWKELLAQDDKKLNDTDKFTKIMFKDTYQNLCKHVDEKIPKDVAETLLKEFNDPNYVLFVHKTGRVSKEEIFENGLKILSGNDIEKTATSYGSNSLEEKTDFFTDIATAHEYKNSKRAIILKIPVTSFFDYKPGESKPILIDTNEPAEDAGAILKGITQKRLMPEYVLGSVELDEDKVTSFERNPNYKEVHNHSNDGLVCTNGLIENCLLTMGYSSEPILGAPMRPADLDDIKVSQLISKENNEYMKKNDKEYFDIKTTFSEDMRKILDADKTKLDELELMLRDNLEETCEVLSGRIPKDIGEMLLKEKSDPDYVLLCHRTREILAEEVFTDGLLCKDGNRIFSTMDGYEDEYEKEDREIDDTEFMKGIFRELDHKGKAERCLIMKVPKSALEYVPGESKPILSQTDMIAVEDTVFDPARKQTKLLPEYILGSLEFDESANKKITKFISNPNYKEKHDYENDNLVCTECLIEDYRKQKEIPYNDETEAKINKIISKENDKFRKRHQKTRTEDELKKYSKKDMLLSKFNQMAKRIKDFFTKDRNKEESLQDVDKE